MTTPTPYTRYRDYSQYQSDNPDAELNGSDLDTDFDRVKTTTDSLATSLATIRRDDGGIKNGVVTIDSLSTDTLTTLALDADIKGDWEAAGAYVSGDVVRFGDSLVVGAGLTGTGTVDTVAALKALETPTSGRTVLVRYQTAAGDGLWGVWLWRTGDRSASVSADPTSVDWAAPDDAPTGASGAWQRQRVVLTTGVTGTLPVANGGTNATTADGAITSLFGGYTGTGDAVRESSPTFTGQPVVPGLPNLTTDVQSTGVPGLDGATSGFFVYQNPTNAVTGNPTDVLRTDRVANYSGGTSGFVRSSFHATTYNQNAGNLDYEFSIVSDMHNYATSNSQSGAALLYSRRHVSGGAILFGAGITAEDVSGEVDPVNALTGCETDIYANGTDANRKRAGHLVVIGTNGNGGYTKAHGYAAIHMGPTNGNSSLGQWDTQIYGEGTGVDGIDFSNLTLTGSAWKSTDFEVTGDGRLLLANPTGLSAIDAHRTSTPASHLTPAFNFIDLGTSGFNFSDLSTHIAFAITGSTPGTGTGSYQGLNAKQYGDGGHTSGTYITGAQLEAHAQPGVTAGNFTGSGPIAIAEVGASVTTLVGEEVNVLLPSGATAVGYEGIRVADVSPSVGTVTGVIDAAIKVTKSSTARGWTYGLDFNWDVPGTDASFPLLSGGTLIKADTTALQLAYGLDLRGMAGGFSGAAIALHSGGTGDKIIFGTSGAGGSIVSGTTTGGGSITFNNGTTALSGNVDVGEDLYLSRTSANYGYITRPNSSGKKKIQFSVTGGGKLEEVYAYTSTFTASDAVSIGSTLTYGGVTLAASVSGTGAMVLSASPILTGAPSVVNSTVSSTSDLSQSWLWGGGSTDWGLRLYQRHTGSAIVYDFKTRNGSTTDITALTFSSDGSLSAPVGFTLGGALTYGGVTLSNSVTGTGSMVLSAGPTFSGIITNGSLSGGDPTYKGIVRLNTATNTLNADVGIEFKAANSSNGYGWRIAAYDPGGGTPLVIQMREASASWTEVAQFAPGGTLKLANILQLGTAYVAGAPTATGYITIKDSTGTTYKVLVGT